MIDKSDKNKVLFLKIEKAVEKAVEKNDIVGKIK